MRELCSICQDHLNANKEAVRLAYNAKIQAWNKLNSPGNNKQALAYNYESKADHFEDAVSILVHNYNNVIKPRHNTALDLV